jgi:hypothetical protein
MEELDAGTLWESLTLVGEILEVENASPVHLVVVGGSALLAAGIVSRTTEDVDVLAERGIPEGEIVPIRQLSPELGSAARKVATELGLPQNWLNATTALFSIPLEAYPSDLWVDMKRQAFGSCLEVSFLGRPGLIYLKFYAAIDPERKRRKDDRDDLVQLAPTIKEAEKAIQWLHTEELLNGGNSSELLEVLTLLGYEELLP